jgi:hypothetical protein
MPIDSIPISVATLPRIVAGPVLRRMAGTEVSVWVATVDSAELTLKVRARVADGTGESFVSRVPTQVGSHLRMTVLTAAPAACAMLDLGITAIGLFGSTENTETGHATA